MLNGRRNATIGLTAILALIVAEVLAGFLVISLFLEFVVGIDLPYL